MADTTKTSRLEQLHGIITEFRDDILETLHLTKIQDGVNNFDAWRALTKAVYYVESAGNVDWSLIDKYWLRDGTFILNDESFAQVQYHFLNLRSKSDHFLFLYKARLPTLNSTWVEQTGKVMNQYVMELSITAMVISIYPAMHKMDWSDFTADLILSKAHEAKLNLG